LKTALTIALAQIDVHLGQPGANLARVREFAAQAQKANVDLLLLPELWLYGHDLTQAEEWAVPLGEGGFARMATLAREFELHIAGSLLERHAGGVSNSAVLYAPDGALLGLYRKIHLFRLMGEHRHLIAGDHATLCPTSWGKVGLAICYDVRFPELFRVMALAGADLFLIPAQWPVARLDAWLALARARAVENELFVAVCNRVGTEGEVTYPGQSLIVDPLGRVLAEGDDQERLVIAQAELREVRKARRYLTIYEDRRPHAYKLLDPGLPVDGGNGKRDEGTGAGALGVTIATRLAKGGKDC
jgi:predicted amidohydrolase